ARAGPYAPPESAPAPRGTRIISCGNFSAKTNNGPPNNYKMPRPNQATSSSLRRCAAAAAACALLSAAFDAPADTVGPGTPTGPLTLGAPARPTKASTGVYLVQLKQPGAATYKGGTAGFAATKPSPGRKL